MVCRRKRLKAILTISISTYCLRLSLPTAGLTTPPCCPSPLPYLTYHFAAWRLSPLCLSALLVLPNLSPLRLPTASLLVLEVPTAARVVPVHRLSSLLTASLPAACPSPALLLSLSPLAAVSVFLQPQSRWLVLVATCPSYHLQLPIIFCPCPGLSPIPLGFCAACCCCRFSRPPSVSAPAYRLSRQTVSAACLGLPALSWPSLESGHQYGRTTSCHVLSSRILPLVTTSSFEAAAYTAPFSPMPLHSCPLV